MRIVTNTLWLPKAGNSEEEYEDAASPSEPTDLVADAFKCAVSDGATETSFSGLWAKLLVEGYIEGIELGELQKAWYDQIGKKQLPWYAEQKVQSGAFATLLGLTIVDQKGKKGGTWQSEAVGDSCLMHVRGKEIQTIFPLEKSDQFNSSPLLLSSNEKSNEGVLESFVKVSGDWRPGDVFFLMTDAIARWAYKRQEEYGDAPIWLESMSDRDTMSEFAEVQRQVTDEESRPLMRNDDVTLMRIQIT